MASKEWMRLGRGLDSRKLRLQILLGDAGPLGYTVSRV